MLFFVAAVGETRLVPGFLALHLQMQASAAGLTLLVVGFIFVADAMLLVTRLNIMGIARLSETFANATDAKRTSNLAAGAFTAKIQGAISTGALLPLCVASLLFCVALMLSTIPRWLAWMTIVASFCAMVSLFAVQMALPLIIPLTGLFLTALWQCIAGVIMFTSSSKA